MPFVTDPTIMEAGVALGSLRAAIVSALPGLVVRRGKKGGANAIAVVMGILDRMAEGSLSAELLISKGRWRDAAVLVLVVVELRLDLAYIEQDPSRVEAWLSHREEGRKPWGALRQIRGLFPDGKEREAELANYRNMSMIKHGNPASRGVGFGMHPELNQLNVYGDDLDVPMSLMCLAYAGLNLGAATRAADQLLRSYGLDMAGTVKETDHYQDVLDAVHTKHLEQWIKDLYGPKV
jgi:hypothetical protein